jgi:YD repeat-containing protein
LCPPDNRLTGITNKADSSIVSQLTYGYDRVGNRTSQVEADGTTTQWGYDQNYQLIFEQRSGTDGFTLAYGYDPAGNRTIKVDGANVSINSYSAANWLTGEAPVSPPVLDGDIGGPAHAGLGQLCRLEHDLHDQGRRGRPGHYKREHHQRSVPLHLLRRKWQCHDHRPGGHGLLPKNGTT